MEPAGAKVPAPQGSGREVPAKAQEKAAGQGAQLAAAVLPQVAL